MVRGVEVSQSSVTEPQEAPEQIGASRPAPHNTPEPRQRRPVFPIWLSRLGAVTLVIVAVLFAAGEYVAHRAEPMLRQRVIANLQERFHSPVELDALHVSLLHGLQVSGSGLRIMEIAGPAQPDARPARSSPMLSVNSFEFRTGLRQLFEPTMRIVNVYVQGLEIHIPPKQDRGPLLSDDPKRRGQPRIGLLLDKIVCADAKIVIETSNPGKPPLVFAIRNLTLTDVGLKQPLLFDATLVNPKPVGDIHSTGHFGPWQDDNPRDSPIGGHYSFTNADLGTIKGIAGTLSSTGEYSGTLGEIGVVGSTDTPDFALDVSEHPVALHTDFNATVDGTSGDTRLNSVHATLLHTVLQVNGMVIRSSDMQGSGAEGAMPGDSAQHVPGHFIDINVTSNEARVEDILTLAAKTTPPLMQGALTLKAHLTIPPGHVSVSKKMQVKGTFAIRGATFANANWQDKVDALSERAQGHPKEANAASAPTVTSQMSGSFALANALLHVPGLDYKMPGAQVHLAGDYALSGETFEFEGKVRTQATASQMLTGWKSVVAKPFDGLLKKDGAGLEVPIKVSGTKSDPKFGVDLDKMGLGFLSRHKDQPGPGADAKQPVSNAKQ
jgi:hypothetical protein